MTTDRDAVERLAPKRIWAEPHETKGWKTPMGDWTHGKGMTGAVRYVREDHADAQLQAAVAAEREACAAICDSVKAKAKEYGIPQMAMGAIECGDLIRSRSDKGVA